MGRKARKADHGEGSLFRRVRKSGGREVEVGNYIFKIVVNGQQIWENTGTKDLDAARIKRAEILLRLQKGDPGKSKQRITVGEYFDGWLAEKERLANSRHLLKVSSIKKYQNIVALMMRFLRERGLMLLEMRNLTVGHCRDFLDWLVTQGRFHGKSDVLISEKGANGIWKNLRMVVALAIKERIIAEDFLSKVELFNITKERIRLPRIAELEEILGFVEEPEARDAIVVVSVLGTRPSELFNLVWEQIDFRAARPIMLIHPQRDQRVTPKTRSSIREVPIHQNALAILRKWRRERPGAKGTDKVFLCADGRPMADYQNYLYRRLVKAVRAANRARKVKGLEPLPNVTLRLLRHNNASWRINRAEHPEPEVAVVKALGWVDTKMLQETYYHADSESPLAQKMAEAPFFSIDRERFAQGQEPAEAAEPVDVVSAETFDEPAEAPTTKSVAAEKMTDEAREAAIEAEYGAVLNNEEMVFMTPDEVAQRYWDIVTKYRNSPA